ncbi:MAG: hypothetical protein ACXVZX_13290 [Terriglobales bacterium]
MARSPLRDGWRVLMRAPAAVLTEIVWRWTFGVAFWAILYYSFREYFASIEISRAEYALMRSLEPYTWIAVTARVIVAFMMGLRIVGPIVIPALIVLWTALATLGRAGTIRAVSATDPQTNWFSTTLLHLFRVLLGLAAILSYFGCGILIDAAVGDPSRHFAAVFLLGSLALLVIVFFWSFVNWFLSLATIFTVRERSGLFRSVVQTAAYHREHSHLLVSTGLWFAFARSILVIASSMISLWLFTEARPRLAILLVVAVSLVYFAMADALNMWRLATYISFTESEPAPPVLAAPVTAPEPGPSISADPEPGPSVSIEEGAISAEAPLEPTRKADS